MHSCPPFNGSINVENHWLIKSIISTGKQFYPPSVSLYARIPLMQREASCSVSWFVAASDLCTVDFGEKMNISNFLLEYK